MLFIYITPGHKWSEPAKAERLWGQRRCSGPLRVRGNTRYSSWLHRAPHSDSDPEWGQPHFRWELRVSDQPARARHGSLRGSGWRLHWGWVHRWVSGESLKNAQNKHSWDMLSFLPQASTPSLWNAFSQAIGTYHSSPWRGKNFPMPGCLFTWRWPTEEVEENLIKGDCRCEKPARGGTTRLYGTWASGP